MTTCWSDVLDDCVGGQSKEHYLSRSIIGDGEITVSGLPFLGGRTRTIPGKRLTRNMLCKHHNEKLSPLDAAAGYFVRVLRAFMQRGVMRARGARKRGGPDVYRVNGALVERWMLKTIINLMFDRTASEGRWRPPVAWVRCVHGSEAFPKGCGLYLLSGGSQILDREQSAVGIRLLTRNDDDDTVTGGQFRFGVFQFAMMMQVLHEKHRGGFRIQRLKDKPSLDLRQIVHFDWSNLVQSG